MTQTFKAIRADWRRNRGNIKGRIILLAFRLTRPFATLWYTNRFLYWVFCPIHAAYSLWVEWFLSCELPAYTAAGGGLVIFHGQGLVVNAATRIGRDCTLRHNTTIGNKINPDGTFTGSPVIGDRVEVGANVVIIGEITIGDDAVIGAGSVVVKDVPPRAIVVGNPARVIRIRPDGDAGRLAPELMESHS